MLRVNRRPLENEVHSAITVRPARLEDLGALENIETAVFDCDRLTRRGLRYHIRSQTTQLLVLVAGGHVIGYSLVGFRKSSTRARLYSLAVDPKVHGRGFGRALLGAAERAARARGVCTICLEVRVTNARALTLYEKSGYRRFAMVWDYYEDGASALRLEKSFG
jgi:ribosomal-protein-alanine N-acetyltransferase